MFMQGQSQMQVASPLGVNAGTIEHLYMRLRQTKSIAGRPDRLNYNSNK